ncbi:MAG: beta-galactosidase [Elusimicrobia bacterium]|nr:beta-galactosidase [Elusimicrobiota bacterium]
MSTGIRKIHLISAVVILAAVSRLYPGWEGGYFRLDRVDGREIFVDPSGKTFYSRAMCYAWGPDTGEYASEPRDIDKIARDMELMKEHGFNTLNLYGLDHLEEILTWCDENEFAFYPRMNYYELPEFPKTLKEFPDFMNPEFRKNAKRYFDEYCGIFKKHPCVLAIDMDQRWLFPLDWGGAKHIGEPMLGPASINFFPVWLRARYGSVIVLNRLWGKNYGSFSDILGDTDIIKGGYMVKLEKAPWRVDVYDYTLWTINDFLKDLTEYIRKIDIPQRMVTYTTEMPEVCPFPLSTVKNSGLDFVSPVHYNGQPDFYRDWIGLSELLYMVKWHYDLQGIPVYISETGFRSSVLNQNPPFAMYAMGKPANETFIAEMYLRQTALTNMWPWMTGWTHFKFYDKSIEGDFGYIRDDRTLKPVSELGRYINAALPVNMNREKEPEVWIFYPEYSLSSYYASFQQFKSLVLFLENGFLGEFDRMIKEASKYIKKPSAKIVNTRLLRDLAGLYEEKWIPFKFTSSVPFDDKPILIAGNSLEQLSAEDRKRLKGKKLIVMVKAGIEDERYNRTDAWYLSCIGVKPKTLEPLIDQLDINKYFNHSYFIAGSEENGRLSSDPQGNKKTLKCIICSGQQIEIEPQKVTSVRFLVASVAGDRAVKVKLVYSDGSKKDAYLGKTVADWKYRPHFNLCMPVNIEESGDVYLSDITVDADIMKKLKGIVLPEDDRIRVFSVVLENAKTPVSNIGIRVIYGGKESEGAAHWYVPLKEEDMEGSIIARIGNGDPAIVQSVDGRKIVYLYDALTFSTEENELSRDVDFEAGILHDMINRLRDGKE